MLLISLGTCIIQIQSVRVNFACTEGLLNRLTEAIINVRNARLCARCAIFLFKIKRIPFSCRLVKGFTLLKKENSKSIKDVIGDVFCPGKYCFNRDKFESLDGYVTTPRYTYCCAKRGAWLFVHKVPFMLQEHVKTTQTDKTRFFFAKKDELVTQQTIVT